MTPDLFPQNGSERSASARDWRTAQVDALNLIEYERNWDGDDACPVPKPLIDSTIRFFREMELKKLPAPDSVYPLASGAVMAEWHYEDLTVVSAEIREPGKAEVLAWHPERKSVFRVVTWSVTPKRRRIVRMVSGETAHGSWGELSDSSHDLNTQLQMDASQSEVGCVVQSKGYSSHNAQIGLWEAKTNDLFGDRVANDGECFALSA